MSTYTDTGTGVKELVESNKTSKSLLKLDLIVMFVALALLFIDSISNIGSLLYSIAYWGFIGGLILTFANLKSQMLYLGLYGYALVNLIVFFRALFTKYWGFSWSSLFAIMIFGGLGYLVMKQE